MSAFTAEAAAMPLTTRSRVTNGSEILPGIDGRSAAARRYRDLAMAFADELGGEAAMSEPEKALVRQAAAMVVRSETMQAAVIRGEPVEDEELTRLANSVTRILSTLRRKGRSLDPKAPSLSAYLASKRSEADAA